MFASSTSGWVHPASCASRALASLPTVPMTGRPEVPEPLAEDEPHPAGRGVHQHRLAALHAERPRTRYQAVSPLSSDAAAASSDTPSGTGTSRSAG